MLDGSSSRIPYVANYSDIPVQAILAVSTAQGVAYILLPFIDRNNNVVVTEKVKLACPSVYCVIIDVFLVAPSQGCVEVGVEYVDILLVFRVSLLRMPVGISYDQLSRICRNFTSNQTGGDCHSKTHPRLIGSSHQTLRWLC